MAFHPFLQRLISTLYQRPAIRVYYYFALTPPKSDKSNSLRVGSQLKQTDVLTLIGDLSGVSLSVKINEIFSIVKKYEDLYLTEY